MEYRINGFDQIKAFYSIVFEQKYEFKTHHVSLYVFLINQNNRNNWVEWFKLPYDLAMAGACIGSKKTYYNCLADLQEWGFIKYEKGINEFKSPKIKIEVLKCTSTVPQSEPQGIPLPIPQGIPLPIHIYKHITNNIKQITDNWDDLKNFISNLGNKDGKEPYRKFDHLKISIQEFEALKEKGFSKEQIDLVLDSIENYKKNTSYKSLYLTANKWLSKEYPQVKPIAEQEIKLKDYLIPHADLFGHSNETLLKMCRNGEYKLKEK